jgi:hypothetical protein
MVGETVHVSKGRPSSLIRNSNLTEQTGNPKDFMANLKKTRRRSGRKRQKDIRFCKPAFCRAVRQVLEYIGEEPVFGNFRKYDGIIDWEAFAENINHPTRVALCHVLNGHGQKVEMEGKPVVVAREIESCSESEAAEILAKESKAFVRWWY